MEGRKGRSLTTFFFTADVLWIHFEKYSQIRKDRLNGTFDLYFNVRREGRKVGEIFIFCWTEQRQWKSHKMEN